MTYVHGTHGLEGSYAIPGRASGMEGSYSIAGAFPGLGAVANPAASSSASLVAGVALAPAVVMLSSAASAYHGYKRNKSGLWAIIWGVAGGVAPIITPAVAVAQGFGKRKR